MKMFKLVIMIMLSLPQYEDCAPLPLAIPPPAVEAAKLVIGSLIPNIIERKLSAHQLPITEHFQTMNCGGATNQVTIRFDLKIVI